MMKANKWKIIALKDPKLIRIRANLRKLFAEAVNSEIDRLDKLENLYENKDKLTPSQEKRRFALHQKGMNLLSAWRDSILSCSFGPCETFELKKTGTYLEDKVWNPLQKRWICINCYNKRFKTDKQKEVLRKVLEKTEREEREYHEWLSTIFDD